MKITVQPFGEHAILIDWPATVNDTVSQEILAINTAINATFSSELIETVTTYHSIAVYLKETAIMQNCLEALESFIKTDTPETLINKRVVFIPVCYEDCFALDISIVAEKNELVKTDVISLHTAPVYPVRFLGFLPGFPYVSGLDERLHTPRLKSPRLQIPAGSVGIGGSQTGIYPSNSPGGWNIIGQTPIPLFNITNDPPNLLVAGDFIKFESISLAVFEEIKQKIKAGTFQLKTASL